MAAYSKRGYVTFHRQRDGRVTLGTRKHHYLDCPALRKRSAWAIAGPVAELIFNCEVCLARYDREHKVK